MEKGKEANLKIVLILLIVLFFASLIFCAVIYLDKIMPVNIDIDSFSVDESGGLCKITSVIKSGNNYEIRGEFLKDDIKSYELYIAVENQKRRNRYL